MITIKKLNKYHRHALAAAADSHDPDTKVGAVLINRKTGSVIADGYNGFISGAPDKCLPVSRPEKYEYIVHAEVNLLCNAVKNGISTQDCILYCTLSPCIKCTRMLYQAGITEIYTKSLYKDFGQNQEMLDLCIEVSPYEDFFKLDLYPRGPYEIRKK